MLRIVLTTALLLIVACTASPAVAEQPAIEASDSKELQRCITLLAWLAGNHTHQERNQAADGFGGPDTGSPKARQLLYNSPAEATAEARYAPIVVERLYGDKRVASAVDDYCGPFIDPAVLDTIRRPPLTPTPSKPSQSP